MKKLGLFTLPLLLAACGTTGTPGAFLVNVTADKLSADLGQSGTAATSFTFTNKAGSHEVTIDRAMLTWADPATKTPQTVEVAIPAVNLPAGLTCAAAAASAAAACDFNDPGTTYADRSVTRSIADAELFAKVKAANPSITDLPVNLKFTNAANTLGFSFSTAVSGTPDGGGGVVAKAPTPVLSINTLSSGGSQYSGNLSVTVAGNFDAISTVERVILEVTDASGRIDNTTYVSTAANATFSIDTAKYIDGNLTLKAIALTKEGLRGETTPQTVQIANVSAPILTILSPDASSTVTGPTTVRVQLRQRNTAFTLNPLNLNGDDIRLDVRDFRGQIVKSEYSKAAKVSEGVYEAFLPLDLIGGDYSSNSYTLEAIAVAVLSDGSRRTAGATTNITTQVNDNKPPAMTIVMPAYFNDPYLNPGTRVTLTRNSAVMVFASDDNGVSSIRFDFVCDEATKIPTQVCPRAPYQYNLAVGNAGPLHRVLPIGQIIDGQPYVQDGNYTLRMVAYDGSLANIQEFPIKVTRAANAGSIAGLEDYQAPTLTLERAASKFTPASATWSIPGTSTNPVRVATISYDDDGVYVPTRQRIEPIWPDNQSITATQTFIAAGIYHTDFIVEDLVTGVIRYYEGSKIYVQSK